MEIKREAERRDKVRVNWQFSILMALIFLSAFHFSRLYFARPPLVISAFLVAGALLLSNYFYAKKKGYFCHSLDRYLHLIPIGHLFYAGIELLVDVYKNDINAIELPSYRFYVSFIVYFVVIGGIHWKGIQERDSQQSPYWNSCTKLEVHYNHTFSLSVFLIFRFR